MGSNYYWIREIARGGMGQVDLIVRSEGTFRRLCAVKRLHAKLTDDADCRAMFLDEARIAGMLKHPNIVSVFDVGEDHVGPYLIMDYIDGLSVQKLATRAIGDQAELPVAVAVQVVLQAAEGLHAAHELVAPDGKRLELVHRDVSPHNLIVGYDGIVRVTDFGIARALGRTTQTSTGVLKGKLGYMSPEQLRFQTPDQRSDIFALGVVLYELLTLERLYPNKNGQGPRRILSEEPPDVGLERDGLPPQLVELVFQMLAKDPQKRPETALVVAQRLREVLNDLMIMDEEAIELGDYVSARFESETTTNQREISTALKQLDEGTLPEWPVTEPTLRLVGEKRKTPWPAMVGVAVLVVGALAAGMFIGQQPSEDNGTVAGEVEPERPTPVATEPPPDDPLPAELVETEPQEARPEVDEGQPTEPVRPRMRDRNRPRPARPQAMPSTQPPPSEPAMMDSPWIMVAPPGDLQ